MTASRTEKILKDLVAFDTTSRHSNLKLVEYVQSYLAGQGVTSRLVMDETGMKAN